MLNLNTDDRFVDELPADKDVSDIRRQVYNAAYSFVKPRKPSAPVLIHANPDVAQLLGINPEEIYKKDFIALFSGNEVLDGSTPYAMAYAGHQFGNWAGQLGDGRAINLFEIKHQGERWAVQLKGAGATPYSRNADGLAVLRSSIREHLCSEAMYHLGVPTTRSLSLILTGDQVLRDMLYDGHPAMEKGAVVCRVSPSFIRFGNFELFAARKDPANLTLLLDHVIKHFYKNISSSGPEKYLQFFKELCDRTMNMSIHWLRVGFVHGVMNTDNMSALGLTIDYGPYGWLEGYDEDWTPNTTDATHRRYRYGQQGNIALWNLYQLANAILPVIGETAGLEEILEQYKLKYEIAFRKMSLEKIGLYTYTENDDLLLNELRRVLQLSETDMTIFYRQLSKVHASLGTADFELFIKIISDAFYKPEEISGDIKNAWLVWFENYTIRLKHENVSGAIKEQRMNAINPKYVLRNYMAQLAIDAAEKGDYSIVKELADLLQQPYTEQPDSEKWFSKRPEWARTKAGCSMLSCSS